MLVSVVFCNKAAAQSSSSDTLKVYAFVVDGDTIPGGRMLDANVYTRITDRWKKYWAEWTRLRNAVYVTYPYAKAAGIPATGKRVLVVGLGPAGFTLAHKIPCRARLAHRAAPSSAHAT